MTHDVVPVRTVEDVRAEFAANGVSVSEWAVARGLSPSLVYQVLAGRKAGMRGQSHRAAVLLGLKPRLIRTAAELQFVHQPALSAPT